MVFERSKMLVPFAWNKSAWKHYMPPHLRTKPDVYGFICISPSNRIALVKGISGKWSFPKGHVKDNETSIQCALRELREETSIQLSQDILYSHYKELASGGYFIYTMEEEASMIPEDTCEIQECGWFTLEQMKEMDCNVDVNRYLTYRARELKCESPTWRGTLPSPLRQNTTQGTYQDAMLSP